MTPAGVPWSGRPREQVRVRQWLGAAVASHANVRPPRMTARGPATVVGPSPGARGSQTQAATAASGSGYAQSAASLKLGDSDKQIA